MQILLVDSNPRESLLIAGELEAAGHDVDVVADASHALQRFLDAPVSMLVVSPTCGRVNALELCRTLRRSRSGRTAHVLMLLDDEARMSAAFDAGVDDVVLRPFQPGDVANSILRSRRLVALRQQVDQGAALQRTQLAQLARLNRKLRAAALVDETTELPNRRCALTRLAQAWEAAEEEGTALSALTVQIDFAPGCAADRNELVRALAEELRPLLAKRDLLARFRGQMLLVVQPGADAASAAALAESARRTAHALLERRGLGATIAVAVGVATKGPGVVSAEELCAAASRTTRTAGGRG